MFNESPNPSPLTKHFTDIELAYVHQRYKEIHDMVHVLLEGQNDVGIDTEVTVKYFEMAHYGLPVGRIGLIEELHLGRPFGQRIARSRDAGSVFDGNSKDFANGAAVSVVVDCRV